VRYAELGLARAVKRGIVRVSSWDSETAVKQSRFELRSFHAYGLLHKSAFRFEGLARLIQPSCKAGKPKVVDEWKVEEYNSHLPFSDPACCQLLFLLYLRSFLPRVCFCCPPWTHVHPTSFESAAGTDLFIL
jgi:hypothetical protein